MKHSPFRMGSGLLLSLFCMTLMAGTAAAEILLSGAAVSVSGPDGHITEISAILSVYFEGDMDFMEIWIL